MRILERLGVHTSSSFVKIIGLYLHTLNSGIKAYQILINHDEVCIPSLSSILLDVCKIWKKDSFTNFISHLAPREKYVAEDSANRAMGK